MIKAYLLDTITGTSPFCPTSRIFNYFTPVTNGEELLFETHANKLHWAIKDPSIQSSISQPLAHSAFGCIIDVLGVSVSYDGSYYNNFIESKTSGTQAIHTWHHRYPIDRHHSSFARLEVWSSATAFNGWVPSQSAHRKIQFLYHGKLTINGYTAQQLLPTLISSWCCWCSRRPCFLCCCMGWSFASGCFPKQVRRFMCPMRKRMTMPLEKGLFLVNLSFGYFCSLSRNQ